MPWQFEEDVAVSDAQDGWMLEEKQKIGRFENPIGQAALGLAEAPMRAIQSMSILGLPIEALAGKTEDGAPFTPGRGQELSLQEQILDKINRGEQPSFSDLMMLSDDDDLLPYPSQKKSSSALAALQKEIPQSGGVIQEGIARTGAAIPFLLGGGTTLAGEILGMETSGLVGKELAKEAGFGEFGQNVADFSFSFGRAFIPTVMEKTAAQTSKLPAIAERPNIFAKAEIKANSNNLQKNIQTLSNSAIEDFQKQASKISEKAWGDVTNFSAREISENLVKTNRSAMLDLLAKGGETEQQVWKGIQGVIDESLAKERGAYKALYEESRKRARNIQFEPTSSREKATELLKSLKNIETTAPGYEVTTKALQTALEDLGVKVELIGNRVTSQTKPITVDKMMDLAVRLGEVVNYEALTPSIKDLLKPMIRSLKGEIRQALKKEGSLSESIFNRAENSFKNTAERYGNDAILKVRKSETPEQLTNFFSSASNLENLKKVLDPQSFAKAERAIIEQISNRSTDVARKELFNLSPQLSQRGRYIANNIVDMGDKLTTRGQKTMMQQRILEDIQAAVTSGQRPSYTLKSMQTPEGYVIAKETLERTPKGKELFKTMERVFIEDVVESIKTKDGLIDWSKAKDILKEPNVQKVIRNIGGDDAVSFFKNMERIGQNVTDNFALYSQKNQSALEKIIDKMTNPARVVFTLLTGLKFGVGSQLATEIGENIFYRMLSNPKIRNILKSMASPEAVQKGTFAAGISSLNQIMKEETTQ